MRIHLYYLDKGWKNQKKDCAENYNLIIDMQDKTYKVYIDAYYGYCRPEDIEVKRKSDITDYVAHLKRNGFTEENKK